MNEYDKSRREIMLPLEDLSRVLVIRIHNNQAEIRIEEKVDNEDGKYSEVVFTGYRNGRPIYPLTPKGWCALRRHIKKGKFCSIRRYNLEPVGLVRITEEDIALRIGNGTSRVRTRTFILEVGRLEEIAASVNRNIGHIPKYVLDIISGYDDEKRYSKQRDYDGLDVQIPPKRKGLKRLILDPI